MAEGHNPDGYGAPSSAPLTAYSRVCSCSGNTVRGSMSTLSLSIRAITGGLCSLSRLTTPFDPFRDADALEGKQPGVEGLSWQAATSYGGEAL